MLAEHNEHIIIWKRAALREFRSSSAVVRQQAGDQCLWALPHTLQNGRSNRFSNGTETALPKSSLILWYIVIVVFGTVWNGTFWWCWCNMVQPCHICICRGGPWTAPLQAIRLNASRLSQLGRESLWEEATSWTLLNIVVFLHVLLAVHVNKICASSHWSKQDVTSPSMAVLSVLRFAIVCNARCLLRSTACLRSR